MRFTEEQIQAIDIGRLGENACIVAGPGSGKTTVLVERYRQLIASGIEPSAILAITFTEKAAANMRERLAREFSSDPAMLRKFERAHVSTIHGFCHRLLKENATSAAVDPEFTILDEQLAVLEQARALRETLDDFFREREPAMRDLLDATRGADLENLLPAIYDAMRAAGVRPCDLRRFPASSAAKPSIEAMLAAAGRYIDGFRPPLTVPGRNALQAAKGWTERVRSAVSQRELFDLLGSKRSFNLQVANSAKDDIKAMRDQADLWRGETLEELFAAERETLYSILERFDDLYRQRKSLLAALDFNDLEFYAVKLLEDNPGIRRQLNQDFRQVMIDEFQDTSRQQARLVELVHGPGRFYAVGDLNQSIYSFRHASPAVFQNHLQSVNAAKGHYQELVENWRSREPILLATRKILHEAGGIANRNLVPARVLPPSSCPAIEIIIAEKAEDDEESTLEAEWILARILHLRQTLRISDGETTRPARFSDFAILVRNTNSLKPFLPVLDQAGVPYLNRRTGFFETTEARDLLHLLRMIRNPRDEVSTLAVLRSPLAAISDEGLLRLKLHHSNFGEALAFPRPDTLGDEDRRRFERFRAAFQGWRAVSPSVSPDRLITLALDEMGFIWDPRSASGKNIEKFLSIARGQGRGMTLAAFVGHLEAMRATDPRESDPPLDETIDAVQIMTAHAAKGLEFPIVILAALDKGVEGVQSSVLDFTPLHGLGVKWSIDGDCEPIPGAVHARNQAILEQTEGEESNRLLYVALTRAEEHLILSWSRTAGAKPKNWAKTVAAALQLDGQTIAPEPEIQEYVAPDERAFQASVFCVAVSPSTPSMFSDSPVLPDLEVLDPPRPTGQFEPGTTATALSEFAGCPRKYYLGSYLGWDRSLVRPTAARNRSGSKSAAEIGTEVHALLAGEEVVRPDWESTRLAQVFERSPLGKRAYRTKLRESEWDFVFEFESLIVRGKIDLWFEDAQGLTIVDYKTDDISAGEVHARARDYFGQLQLYAVALERALGKQPKAAWLQFLRPDISVPVPLENARTSLAAAARTFIAAQESLEFPLEIGPHCRNCEFYRAICPARLPAG